MNRTLPLFVLALACSSAPADNYEGPDAGAQTGGAGELDRDDLGTAEQAVVLPFKYGMEGAGNTETCDSTWQGSACWVPNSKVFYVGFNASTCSAWWQARFVEIWNEALADVDYVNSLEHEDAALWYMGPVPAGTPVGLKYQWQCSSELGIGAESFKPVTTNTDDISWPPQGTLRQYKGGVLKAYVAEVEATSAWQNASEAARQRYARNIIRHGVRHMFGAGHVPGTEPGYELMGTNHPNFFNAEYWPTFDEYYRQACYNASNGGLFSDCE